MEGGLETVGRSQRGRRGCGYAREDTAESLSSSTHAELTLEWPAGVFYKKQN